VDERVRDRPACPGEHPGERGTRDAHLFRGRFLVEPLDVHEAQRLQAVERELDRVLRSLEVVLEDREEQPSAEVGDDVTMAGRTGHRASVGSGR
jgi:hypothetical protein